MGINYNILSYQNEYDRHCKKYNQMKDDVVARGYWLLQARAGSLVELTFDGPFEIYCPYKSPCNHWLEISSGPDISQQGGR